MKQKINRPDTRHGLLDLPMANLKKHRGFAAGGATDSPAMVQKEIDFFKKHGAPKAMIEHEIAERDNMHKFRKGGEVDEPIREMVRSGGKLVPRYARDMAEDAPIREMKDYGRGLEVIPDDARARELLEAEMDRRRRAKEDKAPTTKKDMGKTFAAGGTVKKVKKLDPAQKKAVMQAIMMAKQQGAAPQGQAPQGQPPAPQAAPMPQRPPGMKKGGKAHCFADGGKVKKDDKKEKWTPPWAKKKFAAGGSVVCAAGGRIGGKGDGCITRGKTKGRMV